MLKNKIPALVAALFISLTGMAQEGQKQPTQEEIIQQEVERLERCLKLEDWQVFYVDSTLRYNHTHMMEEVEILRRSRVENSDLYFAVQDKWMIETEKSYRKYFTEKQWEEYLDTGGEKIIREREKRQKKVLEATNGKQKKSKKKK